MYRSLLFVFTFFFAFSCLAQDYMPKGGRYGGKKTKYRRTSSYLKRNQTDVFPLDPEYKLNGWFLGFGGTYMIPMGEVEQSAYSKQVFNDTTLETYSNFSAKPSGKLGLFAEAGWFHSFEDPPFFHFLDIGLSYRQYKGGEEFSGSTYNVVTDSLGQSAESPRSNINGSGSYSDQIISLNSKLTHHYHFSRYGFLQNSIGVNIDYFFSSSRNASSVIPGFESSFPEDFQAQIHYRLGVGWKASPTILVVPFVELPLLTAYPFDDFKSSMPYFATRHYPLIFGVRVMFLRRISEDCNVPNYKPPAETN